MRVFITIYFVLCQFIFSDIKAQSSLSMKMKEEVCDCIGFPVRSDSISIKLKACLTSVQNNYANNGTENERLQLSYPKGVRMTLDSVLGSVMNCKSFQYLQLIKEEDEYYKISQNQEVARHYQKGNFLMEEEDYDSAVFNYKQAINLDPNFIPGLDQLAMCYKRMGNLDRAIDTYKLSLEKYPVGSVALNNLAHIFREQGNYKKAIFYFSKLKYWHVNNPEGYFGCAGTNILNDFLDRETMEDIIIAHLLYINNKDLKSLDSEQLLSATYQMAIDKGMLDDFKEISGRYGIKLD